jgi:hypothetical protein
MDRAHEMQEREAREEMRAERNETFLRHGPMHDHPYLVAVPADRPWRLSDERVMIGGRLMYAIGGDPGGTVGFVVDREDAMVATAAVQMLDALETLFDGHGLVTGRRLAKGITKARAAISAARKGGI